MILSTLVGGGHYLVDTLAGVVLGVIAVRVAGRVISAANETIAVG